jgi:hypothetical protein
MIRSLFLCFLLIFSVDLAWANSDWIFEDFSRTYGCPTAYSEWYTENGRLVLHSHSRYGRGRLYKDVSFVPNVIEVKYEAYSPSGHCNELEVIFTTFNGLKVAHLDYGEDSFVPAYSRMRITLLGEEFRIPFSSLYSKGVIKFVFDWGNREARAVFYDYSGRSYVLATKHIDDSMLGISISRVELKVNNSCCDGRNDAYSYFDYVRVNGVDLLQGTEPEPRCDANHLNLCDNRWDCEAAGGEWRNGGCY